MTLTWPGGARPGLSVVVNVEEGAGMSLRDSDRGPEPVDEPGVADRLGIGADAMTRLNPRLVSCSISALGQDGPQGR